MKRRKFLQNVAYTSALGAAGGILSGSQAFDYANKMENNNSMEKSYMPLAISMWDFSWLERRWTGAGYEDWDKVLAELKERGYNALRIDAYPHLVAENSSKLWTLNEVWSIQNWGSPDINKVQVQPNLNTFIAKCRDHGIRVGLSTWFRNDVDNTRMKTTSPEKHTGWNPKEEN